VEVIILDTERPIHWVRTLIDQEEEECKQLRNKMGKKQEERSRKKWSEGAYEDEVGGKYKQ
jgi:hypothetical protein